MEVPLQSRSKHLHAVMAELVDALDSGSSWGNSVKVQVFLAAIGYNAIL